MQSISLITLPYNFHQYIFILGLSITLLIPIIREHYNNIIIFLLIIFNQELLYYSRYLGASEEEQIESQKLV